MPPHEGNHHLILSELEQISSLEETMEWRIGDAAALLKLTTANLRDWQSYFEEEGLSPRTLPSGHRLYSKQDLERFWIVKFLLRTQGFTKDGVKAKLRNIISFGLTARDVVSQLENLFSSDNLSSPTEEKGLEEELRNENKQLHFKINQFEERLTSLKNALIAREQENARLEDDILCLEKELEDSTAQVTSLQRQLASKGVTYVETNLVLKTLLGIREQLSAFKEEAVAPLSPTT